MSDKLENKLLKLSSALAAIIFVLAPVWPFASVWLASGTGHYTLIRLVLALALVLLILAVASLLIFDRKLATNLIQQKWFWPLAAFVVLEIIWGVAAYLTNAVSLMALGYAWIVDLRFLLFFVAVYLLASRNGWLEATWKKLIFIPALIVAVFAILQFLILPLNFLSHFGYNSHTIFPYETINHNKNYIRAMGFTRGANPLGAYMLLAASLAASLLAGLASLAHLGPKSVLRGSRTAKVRSASVLDFEPNCTQARKSLISVFVILILSLAALVFSFSRSAWVGVVVSFILLIFLALTSAKARKLALGFGVALVIVFAILFASFHNNSSVSNVFLHTQRNSASKISSNQGHVSALKNGFDDFSSYPLGKGPGTAGPASVYNSKSPARISENYYLMIGQEDGWLGLALLLAIFVLVARALAIRKSILALGLLASFAGLAVTNFLLPAWTDITLAYIFWGLAGVALAKPPKLATSKT